MNSSDSAVRTVIFCGGQGTRLREETEFKPKPLVEIGGLPILGHIMRGYAAHGYNDFILCLGYKGYLIKEYFLNYRTRATDFTLRLADGAVALHGTAPDEDMTITCADTGESTLTGERLLRVRAYLEDGPDVFMATYGDGVSDVDIPRLLAFHRKMGRTATITGVHGTSKYGLVRADSRGVVRGFAQKPRLEEHTNGGFMVFSKRIFRHLRPGEMIEDVFIRLAAKGDLAMYRHEGFWHCMDTLQDVRDLNAMVARGTMPWVHDPARRTA